MLDLATAYETLSWAAAPGTPGGLDPNQAYAVTLLQLWAQVNALQQIGGMADASTLLSDAYNTAYKSVLRSLEFVDVDDMDVDVEPVSHAGNLRLSDLMRMMLSDDQAASFDKLVDGLPNGDTDITNFSNFWWSKCYVDQSGSAMAIMPADLASDGSVEWSVYRFKYNTQISDWRALFVSHHYSSVKLSTNGTFCNFSMADFNNNRAWLEDQLGSAIQDAIRNAPLG